MARCRRCGKTGCGCAPPGEGTAGSGAVADAQGVGEDGDPDHSGAGGGASLGRGGRVSAVPAPVAGVDRSQRRAERGPAAGRERERRDPAAAAAGAGKKGAARRRSRAKSTRRRWTWGWTAPACRCAPPRSRAAPESSRITCGTRRPVPGAAGRRGAAFRWALLAPSVGVSRVDPDEAMLAHLRQYRRWDRRCKRIENHRHRIQVDPAMVIVSFPFPVPYIYHFYVVPDVKRYHYHLDEARRQQYRTRRNDPRLAIGRDGDAHQRRGRTGAPTWDRATCWHFLLR